MAKKLRFHVTHHAALRISERGLSLEEMKNVIIYSKDVTVLSPGQNGGKLKRFKKTTDGKTLVVVAEMKGLDCWIATGFYEN